MGNEPTTPAKKPLPKLRGKHYRQQGKWLYARSPWDGKSDKYRPDEVEPWDGKTDAPWMNGRLYAE